MVPCKNNPVSVSFVIAISPILPESFSKLKLKAGETSSAERNHKSWIPLGEKSPEIRSGAKDEPLVAQRQTKWKVGFDRVTPRRNSKNFRNPKSKLQDAIAKGKAKAKARARARARARATARAKLNNRNVSKEKKSNVFYIDPESKNDK